MLLGISADNLHGHGQSVRLDIIVSWRANMAFGARIQDVRHAAVTPTTSPGRDQNASSGNSIASSDVASAISRSAASRGSTVAAKNPAAATLPW